MGDRREPERYGHDEKRRAKRTGDISGRKRSRRAWSDRGGKLAERAPQMPGGPEKTNSRQSPHQPGHRRVPRNNIALNLIKHHRQTLACLRYHVTTAPRRQYLVVDIAHGSSLPANERDNTVDSCTLVKRVPPIVSEGMRIFQSDVVTADQERPAGKENGNP